ncbi:MAG TPA: glycoside hydrolase family 3 N-terminal domain-containing protein [Streptosporangiaceae bacterium]|nr:glycoside hydrolase family 3 N-terminal domain-containing protein [Streptosporangiaceae bacterium]
MRGDDVPEPGLPGADPGLDRLADAVLIPPFPGHAAPEWVLAALRDGLGGVTVFGPNIAGLAQLAALTARLRSAAVEPLIAIDEEGGDVTRIGHLTGSRYPGNAALGAVDDVVLTQAVYAALGADLAALGINVDLAPSVDVNTAADNPVIGTRSFGDDTGLVARHAAAAVSGLQAAGVAACAKHFPGHGSTRIDTHDSIATVDVSLSLLKQRDLPPFEAAIAAGVRAIMPGHLRVPDLTGDLPASLSAAAQTGLLRGELGFTGVIVSDALEMRAVSGPFGIPEAAVRAVMAGTDLLCFGRDQDRPTYLAVRDALVDAVVSGRMPASRLEDAAARVADLRTWTALGAADITPEDIASLNAAAAPAESAPATLDGAGQGPAADGDVGLIAARRAVRVSGRLDWPLQRPVVFEVVPPPNVAVGDVPWGLADWLPADSVLRVATGAPAGDLAAAGDAALTAAAGRSLVVVVRDAHRYPSARDLVTRLLTARPDAVVVEMGLPVWQPRHGAYVATYGAAGASGLAAAEILGLADPV